MKDINWFYENQDAYDKIISNIIFLFVSIYLYSKNNLLSLSFWFYLFVQHYFM